MSLLLPHKSPPLTALAPMQNVTDLAFMQIISHYGAPDYFFTEFLRVHAQSRPEKHILAAIDHNDTNRPVFAQLIGEHIPSLLRTVAELLKHPIAGIDLNLGCPIPKIYKKNVGGGLLREPEKISAILRALREALPQTPLTVKMRIGFADDHNFDKILDILGEHRVDLLSLHARTVLQLYRGPVDHRYTARAVKRLPCPVLANGEISSAWQAKRILEESGAAGVMIGRHAIRNPWIFSQCQKVFSGQEVVPLCFSDVYEYILSLLDATCMECIPERAHINYMKKFLNFIGQSIDAQGDFLHAARRVHTREELKEVLQRHLLSKPTALYSLEPYPGIVARPNRET